MGTISRESGAPASCRSQARVRPARRSLVVGSLRHGCAPNRPLSTRSNVPAPNAAAQMREDGPGRGACTSGHAARVGAKVTSAHVVELAPTSSDRAAGASSPALGLVTIAPPATRRWVGCDSRQGRAVPDARCRGEIRWTRRGFEWRRVDCGSRRLAVADGIVPRSGFGENEECAYGSRDGARAASP